MKDNHYLINNSFQRYLVPSILAILGGNISFMIDHVIAGRVLGSNALAAMSMVNPLFFLLTTIGTLICVGASTLASISIGSDNRLTANKLFTISTVLILVLGGLLSMVGFILLDPIVNIMSNGKEMHDMVYAYCRGLIPGSICIMAVYIPLNFFRIEGRGHLGMIMFLIMAALDIALDLLFTVVMGMGMFGLALATVLSALIAVITMFPFLFIKGGGYRFVSIGKSIRLVNGIVIAGSPPALNNFYAVIRTFFLNMLILSVGGPVAVASFAFINSVNTLAQAVVSGISQTVSPLVGVFYGEHDVLSIKKVFKLAVKFGIASMVVFGILISVFSRQICLLFGLTLAEQQSIAIPALIICSISLVGAMVNNIFIYYYMTIGRTKIANRITLGRGLLFILLAAFILSQAWGIYGIWISFSVSELLTLLLIIMTVKQTLLQEKELRGMLLLNYRDVAEGRFISFSVDTHVEAVMESSDKISEFCENCNLNPKQSMVISLAIEEILLLMLQHVFEGKNNDSIDVRIFVREDLITMRFRCAGRKFNPLEYYNAALEKSNGSEDFDSGESMGLRLISKMAKKVDYTTSLGLNNIIIRI
jgi:Na+-driven multidrug efflux pump/anti-sigma regulatory factor (Ser/Thr protein kinase)